MFLVGKKQKHVFAAQKNHLIETALINNKKNGNAVFKQVQINKDSFID